MYVYEICLRTYSFTCFKCSVLTRFSHVHVLCHCLHYFAADKPVLTDESLLVKEGSYQIPRANVAHFMLDCVQTDQYDKKFVAIAI